jgi:hypothetical protein
MYAEAGWDERNLGRVHQALERMLRQHEPFPVMVMDRYWNVVMTNSAAPCFFNLFVNLSARPKPRNLLHLMFDPAGMQPHIANWEEVGPTLIQRIYREAIGRFVDDKFHDLIASLLAHPGAKAEWRMPQPSQVVSESSVIPISLIKDGYTLSYFSMITTVATPQTAATEELRIESMFPLDDATEAQHLQLLHQPKEIAGFETVGQ